MRPSEDPPQLLRESPRLLLSLKDPEPQVLGDPREFQLSDVAGAFAGQRVDKSFRALVAVRVRDRTEVFSFLAKGEDDLTVAMAVFERDLMGMIASAEFLPDVAPTSPEAVSPGPLAGLWQGIASEFTIGLDATLQPRSRIYLYVFYPSGYFYEGTPPTGTRDPGADGFGRQQVAHWGSYRVTAGKVTLTYADGRQTSLDMDAADSSFACGKAHCAKVESVQDGRRITGDLRDLAYSAIASAGGTGGVSSARLLRFTPDGGFVAAVSKGGSRSSDKGGSVASAAESAAGSYRIANGLLLLSYNDGRPDTRELIYQSGRHLFIGTSIFDGSVVE